MKQSLLLFIAICCHTLLADSYFQTNYNTYNQFSTFENQFTFKEKLSPYFTLNYQTLYTNSVNSYFDRSTKTSNYNFILSFDRYDIKPFVEYDYQNFFNTGLPENTEAINDKKMNYAGLGAVASLLNNTLVIEQKNNYIKLDSPSHSYYGWRNDSKISYAARKDHNDINSAVYYLNNDIFLDRHTSHGAEVNYSYQNTNHIKSRLRYNQIERMIYTYETHDDTSTRDEYSADINFKVFLTDRFSLSVSDNASFRRLNYKKNYTRDNWTFDNDFIYQVELKTDLGEYYTRLNLINSERYLKSNDQYRTSEEKRLSYGIKWSFTFLDTLQLEMSNSLVQNFHSDEYKILDNDRAINAYTAYLINIIGKHKVRNTIQYFTGEQVYIDKMMSANNHDKRTYLWSPEAEIYLHRDFRLINKYYMLADYEYFVWENTLNDRFYRTMNAEWGVKYLNENSSVRGGEIHSSAFECYTAFMLTHSETAEYRDDNWHRFTNEYQQIYLLSIQYQNPTFACGIQPQIKFFNDTYETEIQAHTSITLDDLHIAASINPIGRQFNEMIWRFDLAVGYRF